MRSIAGLERDSVSRSSARRHPRRQIKLHGAEAFAGHAAGGAARGARRSTSSRPTSGPASPPTSSTGCATNLSLDHGAVSAPLNYRGFPKSICTSVNHVVCHGIPGDRRLIEGDILNIDVTPILDGWHGDTSRMFFVGEHISVKARRLVEVTYEAMMRGIAVVRPGVHIGDIGHAIQSYAEGAPLFGGARFLRPRRRPRLSRRAVDPALRPPRGRAGDARGHVLHRRADDQRRPLGGEGAERRLDRGDQGPLAVGAVRAHGRV